MPTAAFDMIGTFFSLEPLRPRLEALGAPRHALELWFAGALRDFFGTSHGGGYVPLGEVLRASLPRTLEELGVEVPPVERLQEVVAGLRELPPSPGAPEAVALLADAGWTLLALTNGAEANTRTLLQRAGLLERFAAVLSTDSISTSKPHRDVYALAQRAAVGEPWMVAAHGWDLQGAARAGLRTAWVTRKERRWLDVWPAPDVQGTDLAEVARTLVARGG